MSSWLPHEKRVLEIQDRFGKREGEPLYHSILEITGRYPLVGYFTYGIPGWIDDASYPLLDDTSFQGHAQPAALPGQRRHLVDGGRRLQSCRRIP